MHLAWGGSNDAHFAIFDFSREEVKSLLENDQAGKTEQELESRKDVRIGLFIFGDLIRPILLAGLEIGLNGFSAKDKSCHSARVDPLLQ